MMRSLYAGVAGLKTHQTRMDVIGNNIANVNTTAYKSQSMTFSDLMYQTTQAASGANATTGVGGVNARQIGLGAKTGAIKTAISGQGASQTTNDPFDIMITGDAFFVVSNGADNFFTRDGSFYVDGKGNLAMTSNGYNVMGWQVDPTNEGHIKQDTVTALRIMTETNMTYPPEETSRATVSGIIDKNDTNVNSPSGKIVNLEIYDKQGYKYTAKFSVHAADGDTGKFYVQLDNILDATGRAIDKSDISFGSNPLDVDIVSHHASSISQAYTPAVPGGAAATVTISLPDGTAVGAAYTVGADVTTALRTAVGALDATGKEAFKAMYGGIDVEDTTFTGFSFTHDGTLNAIKPETPANAALLNYKPGDGSFDFVESAGEGSLTLSFGTLANFSDIEIDFSATSNLNVNGASTINAVAGDSKNAGQGSGRKIGEMSGIAVQKDGMIYASYDNGQSRLLGQIATASFANASGLAKEGDNLYSATQNSGDFDGIGSDITVGGGYMNTGVLEMSNVDLSAEFTEMITTQRGFQANSRIITVSDTLLEELTNLKR